MEILYSVHFWSIISFLMVLLLIIFKAKNAVIGSAKERRQLIKEEVKAAENLKKQAQELLEKYNIQKINAERKKQTIINNSKEIASFESNKIEQNGKKIIEKIETSSIENINKASNDAVNEISTIIKKLMLGKVTKFLTNLENKNLNINLTNKSIKELKKINM